MALAWSLTLVAITGVIGGVMLGQSRWVSSQVAAAGGGLLFGIALFWLMPEIAAASGWMVAVLSTLAACAIIAGADALLMHAGHSPRTGAIAPLLVATGVHCFLDGWSVRALGGRPMTDIAVAVGLALHKAPEGVALGWAVRRTMKWPAKAFLAGSAIEFITALAAYIEPRVNASGMSTVGHWWEPGVLAVISGSFLFLGFHVVVPERKKRGIIPMFVVTLVCIAALARVRA
jgi:hypothetical protein